MSNSFRTARQVIEHQRKTAKAEYDQKLVDLRQMEAVLQSICPHAETATSPGFADLDPYTHCLDCGAEITNDDRSGRQADAMPEGTGRAESAGADTQPATDCTDGQVAG